MINFDDQLYLLYLQKVETHRLLRFFLPIKQTITTLWWGCKIGTRSLPDPVLRPVRPLLGAEVAGHEPLHLLHPHTHLTQHLRYHIIIFARCIGYLFCRIQDIMCSRIPGTEYLAFLLNG